MLDDPSIDQGSAAEERAVDPIESLVLPVWRAKWWILVFGVVGLGGGAFKAAITVNTFDSGGKLLVRSGVRESATPEQFVVTGGAGGQVNARESLANEILLLRDSSVFRHTVALVGSEKILAPYDPSSSDGPDTPFVDRNMHRFQSYWSTRGLSDSVGGSHLPDDCAACMTLATAVVAKGLSIFPEPGSSVVSVSYTAQTPQLAADVANAYLQAAIDHHREFYSGSNELQLIDTRLKEAREELRLVDIARTAFQNECNVYDIESQVKSANEELATLRAKNLEEHAREAGLKAMKTDLDAKRDSEPVRISTTTEQPKAVNPQYTELMKKKLELELQPLGDTGGSIQKQTTLETQRAEQIRQVEAKLAAESQFVDPAPLKQWSYNPLRQQLELDGRKVEGELLALEQSQKVRAARISDLEGLCTHLASCRGQSVSMELAHKAASSQVEQCTQAHEKASLYSLLDQSQLTNLLVLSKAEPPLLKSGPQRGKIVLIGAFLGACAGGLLGLLRQKLDRRIHRAGDLEQFAGIPVLESVPEAKLPRRTEALSP